MMPDHVLRAQQLAFDAIVAQLSPLKLVDLEAANLIICLICPGGGDPEEPGKDFFVDTIEYLGEGYLALDVCELTEPLELGNKPRRKEGTRQRLVIHRDKITPPYVPVLYLGIIAGLLMRMRAGMPLNMVLKDVFLDRAAERKKNPS